MTMQISMNTGSRTKNSIQERAIYNRCTRWAWVRESSYERNKRSKINQSTNRAINYKFVSIVKSGLHSIFVWSERGQHFEEFFFSSRQIFSLEIMIICDWSSKVQMNHSKIACSIDYFLICALYVKRFFFFIHLFLRWCVRCLPSFISCFLWCKSVTFCYVHLLPVTLLITTARNIIWKRYWAYVYGFLGCTVSSVRKHIGLMTELRSIFWGS